MIRYKLHNQCAWCNQYARTCKATKRPNPVSINKWSLRWSWSPSTAWILLGESQSDRYSQLSWWGKTLCGDTLFRLSPPELSWYQGSAHIQHIWAEHASNVDDLIEAMVRMMDAPFGFTGPVNIGNPVEFTILELAWIIHEYSNSRNFKAEIEIVFAVNRANISTRQRTLLVIGSYPTKSKVEQCNVACDIPWCSYFADAVSEYCCSGVNQCLSFLLLILLLR